MALFGLTPSKPKTPPTAQATAPAPMPAALSSAVPGAAIFDVTSAEFQDRVLKASLDVPVLVDFWAPWCGPCKQLMPVLEAEVAAAKGEVLLAKVNIDENPDLAQALKIQSVPTVMAFFQGQPVTGFAGARPASEIKKLIDQLVQLARSAKPDALDIPAAIKEAATLMTANDFDNAQRLYMNILMQDENNADAYAGMVRILIAAGAVDQAEEMLSGAPEALQKNSALISARTAIDVARKAGEASTQLQPLLKKVADAPDDLQARMDLAQAQFGSGDKAAAIDTLLEVIRIDRTWNEEAARKELLWYFEALGFADPLSMEGRKKLSRLLFS